MASTLLKHVKNPKCPKNVKSLAFFNINIIFEGVIQMHYKFLIGLYMYGNHVMISVGWFFALKNDL